MHCASYSLQAPALTSWAYDEEIKTAKRMDDEHRDERVLEEVAGCY